MSRPSGLHVDRRVLGLELREQHAALREDLTAITAADPAVYPVWLSAWRKMSQSIDDHFVTEETLLLPEYAAHDEEAARQVADEHARVREALDLAHVRVLHSDRRTHALLHLAHILRECAAFEERTLYAWVLTDGPERPPVSQEIPPHARRYGG